ncbi:ABC-2 type transport system permease protein [Virgibacillus subterraneus]|uniref:ABC-2 type transport system permease protein n=1 Tax=Virgibacillus subterraneus TaxID=621109 RepID=A0A1H9IPV5_9BACI|nr:ABC transporter permease [Virgibacillus subterraneus]SEQ76624.1 ABC-2 type transport system permease protein [Virgibacillus subterraneus]
MSNFFKLLVNEQYKLYIRKSTWVMYILVSLIILGLAFLANFAQGANAPGTNEKYQDSNWKQTLQQENEDLKKQIEEEEMMQGFNARQIEENNYYLDNDIQPSSYDAWQFVMENEFLLSLVSLFTIIVAAGIIANEFKWGTIKLLLIRPITRTKILLSKYVSVLLFALFTLLYVLVFSWVVGILFFGINGMDPHIVLNQSESYSYVSVIQQIIEGYGFQLVTLLMMATFAFMISAIFRQSSLAIGIAIFLMLAGNAIVTFFADYSWAKYIMFANTDLSQYTNGTPWLDGMSLGFSITVLVVYYLIFLVLSWVFFTKRDVAGQ